MERKKVYSKRNVRYNTRINVFLFIIVSTFKNISNYIEFSSSLIIIIKKNNNNRFSNLNTSALNKTQRSLKKDTKKKKN